MVVRPRKHAYLILQKIPGSKVLIEVATIPAKSSWDAMGGFIDLLHDTTHLQYDSGDLAGREPPEGAICVATESSGRLVEWWWYRLMPTAQ